MGRRNRAAAAAAARKAQKEGIINVGENITPWVSTLHYGIIPTIIPHTLLSFAYFLTLLPLEFPLFDGLLRVLLRLAPTTCLLWRMYEIGREDHYTASLAFGHLVSMGGDLFMMPRTEVNYLRAIGFYTLMHGVVTCACGYRHFASSSLTAVIVVGGMVMMLILPFMPGYLYWYVPMYIGLILAFVLQRNPDSGTNDDMIQIPGAVGTLFYLMANINFSMNLYGSLERFSFLQILTLTFYIWGQLLMTISSFDVLKCMKLEMEAREANKLES